MGNDELQVPRFINITYVAVSIYVAVSSPFGQKINVNVQFSDDEGK